MYESPITQILGEIQTTVEDDCMKVVQQCGFNVNKEELIKALSYDRNQYAKGYEDGYNKAIDDFAHNLKETLNQDFPMNYASTRPYFTLENARLIVDDVAKQLKDGGTDGRNQ